MTASVTLDRLPPEILWQILFESLEPNLLLTCRRVYRFFPCRHFIEGVPLLAFAPPLWPPTYGNTHIPPIELPSFLAQERLHGQKSLQERLCKTTWLSPRLLHHTQPKIYQHVIEAIIVSTRFRPFFPQKQLDEFHDALMTIRQDNNRNTLKDLLEFEIDGQDLEPSGFFLAGDMIQLRHNGAIDWINVFTGIQAIPDSLLIKPPSKLVNSLLNAFAKPFEDMQNAPLDPILVEAALLRVCQIHDIQNDRDSLAADYLETLCWLNGRSKCATPITVDMVQHTVRVNNYRSLEVLLGKADLDVEFNLTMSDLILVQFGLDAHQVECFQLLCRRTSHANPHTEKVAARKVGFTAAEYSFAHARIRDMFRGITLEGFDRWNEEEQRILLHREWKETNP